MIRVLLIHGHYSQKFIDILADQMEVDLIHASSLQAGKMQMVRTPCDIILTPAPGLSESPESTYLSELIQWNQESRAYSKAPVFLLFSTAGQTLFIIDISVGIVSLPPVQDASRSLITTFRQAANRRRLERSFRIEYDLQNRIISTMPLAYCSCKDGIITDANPAFTSISGQSLESLKGLFVSDLISHNEESDQSDAVLLTPEESIPVCIHHPAGPDSCKLTSGFLFLEDRREVRELTTRLCDTERECREKLWLSETLVLKMDQGGVITFANNATLTCFDYKDQGLTGDHISILLPPGIGPELIDPIGLFLGVANESEPTAIHIMEHQRRDGGKIYIAWTTKAYYTSTGELTGLLCIGTDMTEHTPEGEGRISTRIWRDRVIENTDILPEVFDAVLQACIEIAREGREGKPVGTAFLVGDRDAVMARSRQLILNPFFGHPEEMRMVIEKDVREMLKEYALLDGAFVVSGNGLLEAAGRYITVDASQSSLPKGMGTRHSSTAAITTMTRAVGLVVSESGGRVSVIKEGKIVKVIG